MALREPTPPEGPLAPVPRILRPQRALPSEVVRPTRAEVNLAHLRHNLRVLQRVATGSEVWCVLKADAYGHGSKAVARTLERAGVAGVCVALLEEAIELREAGVRLPILVMGGYFGRAWGELLHHELIPVLHDPGQIEELADELRYATRAPLRAHLKVDTGMGRLGVRPAELPRAIAALQRHPEVQLHGLMTHLACADGGDVASVEAQLARFAAATATLTEAGFAPAFRHAANSAAVFGFPSSRFDAVRPGLAVFGIGPEGDATTGLRPVMSLRTEVVALRELSPGETVGYGATWRAARPSRIATIPVGYADGYSRALSGRGAVLIRGRRAPIAGVVSMDLCMIDVTDVEGAQPGDDAVLLGTQSGPLGSDTITAGELAALTGTIPWEVLTSVSRRVPRFYREP